MVSQNSKCNIIYNVVFTNQLLLALLCHNDYGIVNYDYGIVNYDYGIVNYDYGVVKPYSNNL